jgi:hypothetical protein
MIEDKSCISPDQKYLLIGDYNVGAGDNDVLCGLNDGDNVMCTWALPDGKQPLQYASHFGNVEAVQT